MSKKNRPEGKDIVIRDWITFKEMDEEVEIGLKLLKPCASINVLEIINGWLDEWNETPETCTEQWDLVAFPVLADGKVALMFESPIQEYETDEDGDLVAKTLENHYRVLVFDAKSGEQDGQYRFNIHKGYATTVFFKEGKLYAAVSPEGESRYTALQVWPGSDDEHQIRIGDDIVCLAATDAGDIIVSYYGDNERSEEDGSEEETPLISIFCADGERTDISRFYDEETDEPSDDYVIDVTLDGQERIWAMLDDEETAVLYDKDGSITLYALPASGVTALAVPDDCSCLYASSELEEDESEEAESEENSHILLCIPLTEDDEEDEDPLVCAVQTPEEDVFLNDSSSFLKNIMAVLIDGVIYMIDLNEQ